MRQIGSKKGSRKVKVDTIYNTVYNYYVNSNCEVLKLTNKELHQNIIEEYKKNGSVGYTAEILRTNKTKVRRVLITNGLWSSKTSREVVALHEQGLSTKEIADRLCLSEKAVQTYLPYTRVFKTDKSNDAIRCKNYRNRKELAANRQISVEGKGGISMLEHSVKKDFHLPSALKIRLELDLSGLCDEEIKVLHEKADMKKGIYRDVIIPSNLSLHALHYVIQRAFGWQNSHLHNFSFPRDIFHKVTGNSTKRYLSLCGVFFRFPDGDLNSRFFDDDYSGDVSIKTWLKSKYLGPKYCESFGDIYYENQIKVDELRNGEWYPSDDELMHFITDDDKNTLLERLTLMDYLFLPGDSANLNTSQFEDELRKLESDREENIKLWKKYVNNPEVYEDEIIELHNYSTIRFKPQSNRLEYFYDYVDDWKVNISCMNVYYEDYSEEFDAEVVGQVVAEHRPICVKTDGMDLIDDVGGLSGFIRFLNIASDQKNRKFKSVNEWAANRGWSKRNIATKNIL